LLNAGCNKIGRWSQFGAAVVAAGALRSPPLAGSAGRGLWPLPLGARRRRGAVGATGGGDRPGETLRPLQNNSTLVKSRAL